MQNCSSIIAEMVRNKANLNVRTGGTRDGDHCFFVFVVLSISCGVLSSEASLEPKNHAKKPFKRAQ